MRREIRSLVFCELKIWLAMQLNSANTMYQGRSVQSLHEDKISLSNTTNSDSTNVEINSDADSVVVTWWETNQTDETPVMRVSTDNGATFGPILRLAPNGTIGVSGDELEEEEE